ncbi:hypothetical protein [Marinicrinis sediminis]|uniref:Uncharacterized protein n=1 Tax=Marinicrinis sediminis TaxID=1652465 RepID=A0ABW5RET3_9BACL
MNLWFTLILLIAIIIWLPIQFFRHFVAVQVMFMISWILISFFQGTGWEGFVHFLIPLWIASSLIALYMLVMERIETESDKHNKTYHD